MLPTRSELGREEVARTVGVEVILQIFQLTANQLLHGCIPMVSSSEKALLPLSLPTFSRCLHSRAANRCK